MRGVLLERHECIGHQACLLHTTVPDHNKDAVGRILPHTLLPDKRLLEQTCKGVQIGIKKGIASHLHVLLEYLHIPYRFQETYLRTVHHGRSRQRIRQSKRISHSKSISHCHSIPHRKRIHGSRLLHLLLSHLLLLLLRRLLGSKVRVILNRFFQSLGSSLRRLLPILSYRVDVQVLQSSLRKKGGNRIHLEHRNGHIYKFLSTEIYCIHRSVLFLDLRYHSRLSGQSDP